MTDEKETPVASHPRHPINQALHDRREKAPAFVRDVTDRYVLKLMRHTVTTLLVQRDPLDISVHAAQARCTPLQFGLALDLVALIRLESNDTIGKGSLNL